MWYHTVCESKNPNEHGLITAACSKQFHIYMYMYIYIYILLIMFHSLKNILNNLITILML